MNDLHPTLLLALLCLGYVVLARVVRVASWLLLRLVADRGRAGKSTRWTVRLPRAAGIDPELERLRRDQRVRATALLLARVANTILLAIGVVLALAALDVDVVWFVGSVGFLGAGLAFGAQHSVHDFISGLHVLLEDRFFEGDLIEIGEDPDRLVVGTVERVGMFATRLRHEQLIIHVAHRTLTHVRNHSQTWHALRLDLPLSGDHSEASVRQAVHDALDAVTALAGSAGVVDRVATISGTDTGVSIDARVPQGLTTQEQLALTDEVLRRLETEDRS